jgi:hypothetical protein
VGAPAAQGARRGREDRFPHQTGDPDWWQLTTPRGAGQLRIRAGAETGLLDHDFRDPQAAWSVPARVVANGRGADFLITFFQPAVLDDDEFDCGPASSTPNWPPCGNPREPVTRFRCVLT